MPIPFDSLSLDAWLSHLEQLHPSAIDMGLERVARVRDALGLKPDFPVLLVGGTNGKGSVCTMLSSILCAAGYKVGTYTSPHLLHYQERVAINLVPAADAAIVASFQAIEVARADVSLTYFEFGTLAAMQQFMVAGVDVAVLEVGLGGRLDAVNVFEPFASAVVNVGLDHQAYLGDTREAIGHEKAGVYRPGKIAICADPEPPHTLIAEAQRMGANLQLIGQDFGFEKQAEGQQWTWWNKAGVHRHALPFPALRGQYQLGNAAVVLALLDAVKEVLPVAIGDIKRGLLEVELAARFQVLPGRPAVVLDVGHNPHAAKVLRANLDSMGFYPVTHAVMGMMADKDIAGVVELLADRIDVWHLAAPQLPRAAAPEQLAKLVGKLAPLAKINIYENVPLAFTAACKLAEESDRILAFGSFYTVAEVMATRER
ncbi:bifunctional tetrahydrofolate synthase/dihydrofolate synthase [Janthinobacterium sp. B9-8]|uniref:bifunctional tetrahydrofolate synthase/dihydrofolate synthase n=1 Tax=Janthinobacterium sp. B9-8 TaxID=1236179 RepID=UPI00061CF9EE|nr:bifunctional tetrahydrofolate synthase/dihydrofolate synthase [Janthinobacterium sp. B9-8]AMC34328.1 bifunctional folylpolyglutamate synthase/dihydrofolate synthase [Janthinobacterium sp. B9-8]